MKHMESDNYQDFSSGFSGDGYIPGGDGYITSGDGYTPGGDGCVYYREILDEWFPLVRMRVKESSYVKYSYMIQRHLMPALGSKRLDELTSACIQDYLEQELRHGNQRTGGPLSRKYVNDIYSILKETILFSRDKGCSIPCHLKYLGLKEERGPVRVLTPGEQTVLTRYLLNQPDACKAGVLLSLYTGLRIGELCALQQKHICLEEGVLRVRYTLQRLKNTDSGSPRRTRISITRPKSESSVRDIPLPDWLGEFLFPFTRTEPEAFFLSQIPGKPMEPRTLQNRFRRYLGDCGIEHATFHTLRHTFATRCVEKDFELKSLSEILGHGNVSITLNRYVHSSMELKRANMQKLGALL